MIAFDVGKTYYTRSICNHDCIFAYTVTARTAKTITLWDTNMEINIGKRKVSIFDNEEVVYPKGKYSMAPMIRASRIYDL